MKLERRAFLKFFGAAISSAAVPALGTAAASPVGPLLPYFPIETVDLAALTSERTAFALMVRDVWYEMTMGRTEVHVSAYLDKVLHPLIYDAWACREPIDLDLPVFRELGLPAQRWYIESVTVSCKAEAEMIADLVLTPEHGVTKRYKDAS